LLLDTQVEEQEAQQIHDDEARILGDVAEGGHLIEFLKYR
jgi:hypothetical protein